MLRSILSVLAGYAVIVIVVMVVTFVSIPFFTSVNEPQTNWGQTAVTLGSAWYAFEIVYSAIAGFAGGIVTAIVARRSPVQHVFALAGLMLAMGVASLAFSRSFHPASHSIIVTVGGVAACCVGGYVISHRSRDADR